jgi:hypothetical protein
LDAVSEVIKLSRYASELIEPVGSKRKFWYADGQLLFKENRPGTGEDWAEVIAASVAEILGLPHALYTLAEMETDTGPVFGVVSRNFCPQNTDLVLGNELLLQENPQYPAPNGPKYRVAAHTVDRVLDTIQSKLQPPLKWIPAPGIESAVDVFIGYLLLDAVIGNTDRHHENWGAISTHGTGLFLCPTFDHASSLGCHITDAERERRFATRDAGYTAAAYASKARSALYENEQSAQPLGTMQAFRLAGARSEKARTAWLQRLANVSESALATILESLPPERMPAVAVEFAKRLLLFNREQLLAGKEAA